MNKNNIHNIRTRIRVRYIIFFCLIFLYACTSKKNVMMPLFTVLGSKSTGLYFSNNLTYTKEFNLFKYIYFYNGSGVGVGDFNNDGLLDIFFGSNQGQNSLYLNTGHMKFKNVTTQAAIPNDGGWTTGISVVDINNDGLLDIYVCRVGNYETLHSKNQLLINQGIKNGIPIFKDSAQEYGLNFSGFSTQAVFFDYDNDGDLDMYLLNHSVHENGTFRPRKDFLGTYHPLSGDRIYRNEQYTNSGKQSNGRKFTDVTRETGINSSAIGYGLGISVADINLDGYADIYVGNDFHENDYLYINQKNGTFKEEGEKQLMHTSKFSMGVDVADINNDAYPEIISVDMLSPDPYILKRSLSENTYDIFNYKISSGYSYQYTRNNLQYNRQNGLFSEVGLYSGIAATDWSWAPLWMDFDNDGRKDLFISNGIPKRLNDIDYINFVSNGEIQQRISGNKIDEKDRALLDKFPEIKIQNKFYKNNGNLSFTDEEKYIQGDEGNFSNGAAYADFDNDGDLDIVTNNSNGTCFLYENNSRDTIGKTCLQIQLKGSDKNSNAVGARIILFCDNEIRTYEKYAARGFMSSMEIPFLIGLKNTKPDSIILIWPDNTYQYLSVDSGKQQINYTKGLPQFDFTRLIKHTNATFPVKEISSDLNIKYLHQENAFAEFDREPLIPHMLSTEGPPLAVADVNGDGLEDIYIGAARDKKSALYIQQPSGKFVKSTQPDFDNDSSYEDVSACFTDVNRDGTIDIVVASGGNEFYGQDSHNSPRIYINDGKGNFSKQKNSFDNIYCTASTIVPYDFNNDGYEDLFLGARAIPWDYGRIPQSFLLINNRKGKFIDVTNEYAEGLANVGFVTNAIWYDMDNDGDKDLLLSLEWGSLTAFVNDKGKFTKKQLTMQKGWWNFLLPCDINNDGKPDLVAGNLGWNSRLQASTEQPVRLYYDDFDANGKKEQLLTYYVHGKQIPFASKAELEMQMPGLKKQFLYAADFAAANISQLFTKTKLNNASALSADYFSNAVLINKGNWAFEINPLPWQAQLTSYKDAVAVNANGDNLPDILIMGNYYDSNVEMGRYDADFGTILVNKGDGTFKCEQLNGLAIKGQVRHIRQITIKNKPAYVLALNNDSIRVVQF